MVVHYQQGQREAMLHGDEQLAVERDWLWQMLDAPLGPLVLTDEQNNIILMNVHARRLLETSQNDSEGKRRAIELNNFFFSASLSAFVLEQGAALERELTLVDPIEGSELIFELICHATINQVTGERGLVSYLTDVTSLSLAGEALGQSLQNLRLSTQEAHLERDRLHMVLENVADPIVVTGLPGETLLMNPPAERLLQSPAADEDSGRTSAYLANEAQLTSFLFQHHLEPADRGRGVLQFIDPATGKPLTMNVTATKVRNGVGQVLANVCVLHDLTGILELEQRRLQQQLFETEKLAAVGRLAASVAHEINNPLEAIKNALYLMGSGTEETEGDSKLLDIARAETDRVSRIIRQMLGFYRPGTARAPVDINLLIRESVELLQKQLRGQRIMVRSNLGSNLPSVRASADQLKQVFLNLLLNAKESLEREGELTILTRLSRASDEEFPRNRYVLAEFSDNGKGIAKEHLPHIFDPFFTTKRDRQGTGLGLWVSQDIVHQHKGKIKVCSEQGHGTTFTVALPIGDPDG